MLPCTTALLFHSLGLILSMSIMDRSFLTMQLALKTYLKRADYSHKQNPLPRWERTKVRVKKLTPSSYPANCRFPHAFRLSPNALDRRPLVVPLGILLIRVTRAQNC